MDALNVEERDGHLAVRPGQKYMGTLTGGGVDQGMVAIHPADANGQTVTYAAFAALVADAGLEFVILLQRLVSTAIDSTVEPMVEIDFYGEDGEWHEMHALVTSSVMNPYGTAGSTSSHSFKFLAITPDGWANAEPADVAGSGAGYWVRLRRVDGDAWTFSEATGLGGIGEATEPSRNTLYAFTSRNGHELVSVAIQEDGSDVFSSLNNGAFQSFNVNLGGARSARRDDDCLMVYMAATDELLALLGENFVVLAAKDIGDQVLGAGDGAWTPRTDVADTAWEDVPVLAALKPPRVLTVFNSRLFAMAFRDDPTLIRWGAPGEFWDIFPDGNWHRLADRSAAPIIGGVAVHRTLYVFTSDAIWAGHEIDPVEGQDSEVSFSIVEPTGCVSRGSIVAADDGIFFLSDDGVRVFDGQRTRLISRPVASLFREDSEHRFAVRTPRTSVGVWDPARGRYILFYAKPGSKENDSALAIHVKGKSCWIWGSSKNAALDTSGATGPVGYQRRGVRASAAVWAPEENAVIVAAATGTAARLDAGSDDMGQPIEWHAETHHYGFGRSNMQVLESVDIECALDHFEDFKVSVIPDGNRARLSSRTIGAQRHLLDETAVLGQADAAGEAMLELDQAYAPVIARFSSKGRNHRVRVESTGDGAHIRIAAMSVTVNELRQK